MIIPLTEPDRSTKIRWVLDQCLTSQGERMQLYNTRRQYFMFGTTDNGRTIYNRLAAHTDLVASFLYAADGARFTIAAPRNADDMIIDQMAAVESDWNDEFRDSGLAYQFAEALLWATIYDSMFLKMGWNDSRESLFGKIVEPHAFGVFDETEPDLDSQEAFSHSYTLNWDDAVMRLYRAGKKDHIDKLQLTTGEGDSELPAPLRSMIISGSAGPNLTGPLIGAVNTNYEMQALYQSQSEVPKVQFHELWIWDTIAEDYMTVTVCEPDIIISDSRDTIRALSKAAKVGKKKQAMRWASPTNIYLPGEHPFVHICPFGLYNYFWGEAHVDRLVPLQQWSSETLDNIREILEMQVDPAKVFSGFMGLTDEKADALGGPGSWVTEQLPGAKVDRLVPEMPPDLFANFQAIGQIFLEASGLTETVTGKGEAGVRSRGHAKQVAKTGSGRIRKIAVGLEQPLIRLGDLGLRLKQKNDATPLKTDGHEGKPGMEFFLAQIATSWKMRIAGHSHSPLFSDESREMAVLLLKARAIDREMFVSMMGPPNEAAILHALKATMKKEAMQMIAKMQMGDKGKANGAAHAA
jgi:hypothetical protein